MKNKGIFLMSIGLLLLAAAFGLTFYNIYDGNRAEHDAVTISEKLENEIYHEQEENEFHPEMEMPVIELDGQRYIGILEIPALDLRLPVMEEWNEAKLQKSPCRYNGSVYQDNLVIAGHNYKRHFGALKNLPDGTEILFTDVDGRTFSYRTSRIDVVQGTDIERMITEDEWNLTLFTCTFSGRDRYAVRCAREK